MNTVKNFLSRLKKIGFGSIAILLFFIVWEIAAGMVPRGVLSPPTKIFEALYKSATGDILLSQTLISLQRIGMGFLLSFCIAIPVGFLLGTFFKPAEKLLLPFLRLCEKLNPFAIIPVFMILFGIGTSEKVAVVFWATQWPLLFNTLSGARSVDPQLLRSARSMGANRRTLFFKVILPYTLPSIFTGLKIAAQIAFFMIIASEVIGASTGLGWYYIHATAMYNLPLMYGIVLYITVLAIIINRVFGRLEKRFLVWKEASFR